MNKTILGALVFFACAPAFAAGADCDRTLEQLKIQMNVASSNIANAETTRTPEGGAYRRKSVYCGDEGCEIQDVAKFRYRSIPGHPDANADGYVEFPDVNVMTEMSTLIGLQTSYDQFAKLCR
jgi:flagellar basal-body rod protein FlgC